MILRIARAGHPVLRFVAEAVLPAVIPSPGFQGFLDDLLETMRDYDGTGLAAPQVHVSMRVVVLTLSDERGPEFMINPVVTPLTDDALRTWEGCLSLPGLRAAVDRPRAVRVEFLDREGTPRAYELHGFPAVVVQHEVDHLDGVLFVDRADMRTLSFLDEYRRFGALDYDEDGNLVLESDADDLEPDNDAVEEE